MFSYTVVKSPDFDIDKKVIDTIFEKISNIVEKKQNGTLNIVFLDEDSIKKLNNDYRQKNKATDVLSFHYFDDFSKLEKNDIAGEIVMCKDKIVSQAKQYGLGLQKEFYKLLIHSILHILGYDHENDNDYKIMSKLEKSIWQEVFEKQDK